MYKLSRYNHFQSGHDDSHIAYNARSGAVAVLTEENYAAVRVLAGKLSNGSSPVFTPEEQALLEQLAYGRFVYDDSVDEREELKFLHRRARFDESSLGLVIAPTMACNMACEYCFEGDKRGRMSEEVRQAVIDFVRERAPRLESLDICWYGGEPLLAMDLIDELTASFRGLCDEHNLSYSASMISNGYLLSRETADRMAGLKINQLQVTLDGPSDIHNRKRPLKNGKESFATIVENIRYAASLMFVSVRVNVDRSFTTEMIQRLLDELAAAGLRERVAVNFGKIESATKACANISEQCYGSREFAEVEAEFYQLLLDNGFRIESLPSPTATVCMSQQVSSILVDHQGYLYRCFNYVGDHDHAAGRIDQPLDLYHTNFQSLFAFDPFEDAECRECSILPICLGGCPARRAEGDVAGEQLCDSWKHNLEPMLHTIAQDRQQRMRAAAKEKS